MILFSAFRFEAFGVAFSLQVPQLLTFDQLALDLGVLVLEDARLCEVFQGRLQCHCR